MCSLFHLNGQRCQQARASPPRSAYQSAAVQERSARRARPTTAAASAIRLSNDAFRAMVHFQMLMFQLEEDAQRILPEKKAQPATQIENYFTSARWFSLCSKMSI